jgi:Putative 2OG-Fe(II) oxygenase
MARGEAEDLRQRALALHRAQRLIAFMHAQFRYELGYPAADLFAGARRLWPENADVLRNHALALHSEGDRAAARAVLETALAANPRWLAGHQALASLLWTGGDQHGFADHLAAAARTERNDPALWLGWFHLLAQARDSAGARAALREAEAAIGETSGLLGARLFLACEGDDRSEAEALLARTAGMAGDGIALCAIRHALRSGDPARAEAIAVPLTTGLSAAIFWPYVSLCWRLTGNPRAAWLDAPDATISVIDNILAPGELAELGDVLRALHTARAAYLEQTVRGGTQTDRSVLLRHEPALQRARAALMDAVAGYVTALPPPDPHHPLLSRLRGDLRIAGSWSVRLAGQGFNVAHTHPQGWISSAFYVATPTRAELGPAPAGHLLLGTPPAELGLDLPPYREIAPAPGRLALFPSTMWHSTVPFAKGERLNIAFDVVPQG